LKASLEPLSRQKVVQQMLNQADQSEAGPCGNFSEMYRCVCDYLNCPVRDEVEWVCCLCSHETRHQPAVCILL